MSDNIAHALSGSGGGILSMIITYPLVAISSRLQVQKEMHLHRNSTHYKNTLDAFIKILNKEGPKGLYSGFASGVLGIAVTNGVYYYCYEAVKSRLTKGGKLPMTTATSMMSGTLAGIVVVLTTHPIWTVNTRMSVQRRTSNQTKRPTTLQMVLYILKKEGIAGLYSGCKAGLVLVMNPMIQYAIFEHIRARLLVTRGFLTGKDYFLLGAFSKLCATIIMYPYILIKSRLQMTEDTTEKDMSVMEYMKYVIRHEGVSGLYRGLDSKILQSMLSSAFLFYAKEALFKWSVWILILLGARQKINT